MSLTSDLDDAFREWASSLEPKEVEALRYYQGTYSNPGDYDAINRVLRNPDLEITEDQSFVVRKITGLMDSAIGKGALPFGLTVYRGLRDYRALFGDALPREIVGEVINDPAFVSTSVLSHRADRFVDRDYGFRLDLELPAGLPAAWMPAVGVEEMAAQREMLLPRGLEVSIVGTATREGILNVEGRLIA